MTQQEFAEALGITQSMVAMLESGEREPGAKTLRGLMNLTSTDIVAVVLRANQGYNERRDNGKEGE